MEKTEFQCPYHHRGCTWAIWTQKDKHQIAWSCGAKGPQFESRDQLNSTIPAAAEDRGTVRGFEITLNTIEKLYPSDDRWRYFGSNAIIHIEVELKKQLKILKGLNDGL